MSVIKLSKPIEAHGEQVSELTLREPTTADVIEHGQPFLVVLSDDGSAIEIRTKIVSRYISLLAGIPMSSVKELPLTDFSKCQGAVMGFFGQAATES